MRTIGLLRSMLLAVSLTTAAAALVGCASKSAEVTAENIADQGAIAEEQDNGIVAMSVTPDGQARVLVKGKDGQPLDKNVTGTLTVKPTEKGAVPVTVPLAYDEKAKLHVAVIPKLESDVTEVSYDIKADDKPLKGTFHLPPGGTPELVENAKVAADVKLPEGKKGPNGGVIQVVGDDIIEVVADKGTGQVRVYFLDKDYKPVKIVADKKVKIAVVGSAGPQVVVLDAGPDQAYFVGQVDVKVIVKPVKITVAVTQANVTKVVLVGYNPGTVVVVGTGAPVVAVFVTTGWGIGVGVKPVIVVHDDDDDDHHYHYHGKGKGKVHIKGKGVHIKIH